MDRDSGRVENRNGMEVENGREEEEWRWGERKREGGMGAR